MGPRDPEGLHDGCLWLHTTSWGGVSRLDSFSFEGQNKRHIKQS